MSRLHPTEKSPSSRQVIFIFVAVLLALGHLIPVLIEYFLDPAATRSMSANCHPYSAVGLEVRQT